MISLYDHPHPQTLLGKELGVSRWIDVTQVMVTQFGHLTLNPDPMHVCPDWAAKYSPFGTPVSFGFLTLSLMSTMFNEVVPRPDDEVTTLSYGFDRLRLVTPVRVGDRVRGRFELRDLHLHSPVEFRAKYGVTMEIEGTDTPAVVADWLWATQVRMPRARWNAAPILAHHPMEAGRHGAHNVESLHAGLERRRHMR